jgi:Uma2 family endonuclease
MLEEVSTMAISEPIRRHRLTYEDYLLFPEDGRRHELIDGEHLVMPAPSLKHQSVSWNLSYFFSDFLRRSPLGRAFTAPVDVVLSETDVVQPDLIFVSQQRLGILGILKESDVRGAPDLIAEILSPATHRIDEILKLHLYENAGAGEYWMLDPATRTVRVYRNVNQRLVLVAELSADEGNVLETPLLPGLAIPLDEIFR